jgi:hypothetical protein
MLKKHSANKFFVECYIFDTRQRSFLSSVKKKYSAKNSLSSVFFYQEFFAWHSAKHLTLSKEPNSGSDTK